jgi:hypothetical protein
MVVGSSPTWTPKENNMFLILWLVLAAVMTLGTLFYAGMTGKGDVLVYIPLMMVWPIVVVFAAVLAPFVGVYYLGKFLGGRLR